MNRQLKFRVWDKKNKPQMRDHDWLFSGSITYDSLFRERSDIIVMQFTGLMDKNGKEVYEGDIIKRSTGYKFQMKLGQYILGRPTDSKVYGYNWQEGDEVIGNVFESPDLLK